MRIGASRQDDFEINVISLIDVMLTLLMFFVMTTTFVQHSTMKVALPEASETVQESQHSPLVVMIDAGSRFYVDNNEVLNPSVDTLKEAISRIGGDDHERA
ncbi:MAG TPA: biopolymer transporter ExbD, partial [Acetobacteraceae bacterium]|nr:biopolymer transporter ExbD [Acetobacteraceae bacterium]